MAAHRALRTSLRWPSMPRIALSALSLMILAAGAAGIMIGNNVAPTTAELAAVDRAGHASRDLVRTPSPQPTPTTNPPGAETAALTAGAMVATAAKARATKATARTTPVAAGCRRYSGNQRTACGLLPRFGFATREMSALVLMWNHESGWNHRAQNPSSGAYGIPQALPGDKMATAGADWRTNPATQIKWGLGYIKSRYGSPSRAWAFWQANNWY